ncbi:MAG: helix-turn-helix domain-containing protein [Solirubrobacteraceae bacterium]
MLRERGVRMLLDGKTYAHVAESLGVAMSTVAKWSARYYGAGQIIRGEAA